MDSNEPSNKLHIEFEMVFFADHPVKESLDTIVKLTLQNLRETINGRMAPTYKTFGAATYQFPVSGFPVDFSFGGGSPFLIPVLSWLTPAQALINRSVFSVPEMVFDGTIHLTGSGSVIEEKDSLVSVDLDLQISAKATAQQFSADGTRFKATSLFSTKNGMLITSDGHAIRKDGVSLDFHVKKA
jgi:hypothetical protein